MSKNAVPDAWDDDWEAQADVNLCKSRLQKTMLIWPQKMAAEPPSPEPEVKLTKAQRKAKHEEANRQLWEDAEEIKEQPIFLQARSEPAYKSEFKPQMKVLARRPPPKIASRSDATGAMSNLKLQDDEDSDEDERKKAAAEFEERKAKAIREREEKQRKYQEVRERLFGSNEEQIKRPPSSSGNVSSRNSSRGKGRDGRQDKEARGSGSASKDQSPARLGAAKKQLFDPGYTEKPTSQYVQRRANAESGRSTPNEERPIRAPKGPDGSIGFAPR